MKQHISHPLYWGILATFALGLASLAILSSSAQAQNRDKDREEWRKRRQFKRRDFHKMVKKRLDDLQNQLKIAQKKGDQKKVEEIQEKIELTKRRIARWKWRRDSMGRRGRYHRHRGRSILARPTRPNMRDIAHFSLAQIYIDQNKDEKALAELRKVANASPDKDTQSAAQYSIANLYLARKKYGKALDAYLQVDGRYRRRARIRAMALLRSVKDSRQVEKSFGKIIKTSKSVDEEAMARLVLANYYRKRQKIAEAVLQLEKITQIDYSKFRRKKNRKTPSSPKKKGPSRKKPDQANSPPPDETSSRRRFGRGRDGPRRVRRGRGRGRNPNFQD